MSMLKNMKHVCKNGDLTHETVYMLAEMVDVYLDALHDVELADTLEDAQAAAYVARNHDFED